MKLKIYSSEIKGLFLIKHEIFNDIRGNFIKILGQTLASELGEELDIKEVYYSINKINVIRGMHFQLPPDDNIKIINVPYGKILDVVLDIRNGSPTYGRYKEYLIESNDQSIFVSKGLAHGFKCLKDNTIVLYLQTSYYSQNNDSGILWNSFGFDWGVENPIISERDKNLKDFSEFQSPFWF